MDLVVDPGQRLSADGDEQGAGNADLGPAQLFERLVANVALVVQGSEQAIRLAVTCLVAGGHLLIEDVPGVGKTSLGRALAASVSCRHSRIQFTSDLLPSDVVGVSVFDMSRSAFEFRPGPIFANVVLGDEINRTPPKTQSALLESMEERQVTVDGITHRLPEPFMVIATQNPLEHEGTFPLPLSQVDRFLFRIRMGYPDESSEAAMLVAHGAGEPLDDLKPVATPEQVLALAAQARSVYVAPSVQEYIVRIANTTRAHPAVLLGMSPRAGLLLQRAARVRALFDGRGFVTPDDVKAMLPAAVSHRLELKGAGRGRAAVATVLAEILDQVPVPVAPAGRT